MPKKLNQFEKEAEKASIPSVFASIGNHKDASVSKKDATDYAQLPIAFASIHDGQDVPIDQEETDEKN